jgi:hypothetical protein
MLDWIRQFFAHILASGSPNLNRAAKIGAAGCQGL